MLTGFGKVLRCFLMLARDAQFISIIFFSPRTRPQIIPAYLFFTPFADSRPVGWGNTGAFPPSLEIGKNWPYLPDLYTLREDAKMAVIFDKQCQFSIEILSKISKFS